MQVQSCGKDKARQDRGAGGADELRCFTTSQQLDLGGLGGTICGCKAGMARSDGGRGRNKEGIVLSGMMGG